MYFKLWLERKIDRSESQAMVLDAAGVSGDNALSASVSSHKEGLYGLLQNGDLIPFKDEIQKFINNSNDATTLNDLVNQIVQISSGTSDREEMSPLIMPPSIGSGNVSSFAMGTPSTG